MPTYRATSQNPTTNLASQPTGNLAASLLDSMYQTLWNVLNDSSNGFSILATDTGTPNNYVVTNLSPATSYRQGMLQAFLTANVNTGTAQINVDGLGNVAITTSAGVALSGGELSASGINVLIHDGTKFRIFYQNILGPYVIGDTAIQGSYPSAAVLVPRYKQHPDTIWTYGAFDDHFDAGSINSKWVHQTVTSGALNPVYAQAASKLCMGIGSPAATATVYSNLVTQTLPVQATHQISLKTQFAGLPIVGAGNIWAAMTLQLEYSAGNGLQFIYYVAQNSSGFNQSILNVKAGAAFGTVFASWSPGYISQYWRFTYDSSKNTQLEMSHDGITWMAPLFNGPVPGATTGFSTTAPTQWTMGVQAIQTSAGFLQVDWIKHV